LVIVTVIITGMFMKDNAKLDKKFRMTKQRELILGVLRGVYTHPTVDEVYDLVRHKLPHISLGTVYRNLEVLHDQGLVTRLEIGKGQRRYDGQPQTHHHAFCTRCHQVVDLPLSAAPPIHIEPSEASGFQLTDYRLELFGICQNCRAKEKARNETQLA